MPMYVYRIKGTHTCIEKFQKITAKAYRSLVYKGKRVEVERVPQRLGGVQTDYAEPLRMSSVGCDPQHIDRMRAESPSSEYDPQTGEAIFRSRSHMKKCMKERGLREGGRY
jgi:hypothetical protein